MQGLMEAWDDGVRATGGLLVPEKSHWYLLVPSPNEDGVYSFRSDTTERPLYIKDASRLPVPITRLSIHDARRTLGIHYSPDGNWHQQAVVLREKSAAWAAKVSKGGLPRHLVWQAFFTTILKTLQYPLACTCLTESECDSILQPALQALLAGIGVVKTISRQVVYGPVCFQGLGIPHLYDTQTIYHVMKLLDYYASTDDMNNVLFHGTLEAHCILAGVSSNPFFQPSGVSGYVEKSWISFTLDRMHEQRWSVDIPHLPNLPIRENDTFIMHSFLRHGFSATLLRQLNACRLYLRVLTWGDLVEADGRTLCTAFLEGSRRCSNHDVRWPVQCKPSPAGWRRWRTALWEVLPCSSSQSLLDKPLSRLCRWPLDWWYSPTCHSLYQRTGARCLRYPPVSRTIATRRSTSLFLDQASPTVLPSDVVPASVRRDSGGFRIFHADQPLSALSTPSTSSRTFLHAWNDNCGWVLDFDTNLSRHAILRAWSTEGVFSVSDGSFSDGYGTASVSIWDGIRYHSFTFPVPGTASDQSAPRSEAMGVLAQLWFFTALYEQGGLPSRSLRIGCDGLSVLRAIWGPRCSSAAPNYDIISAAQTTIALAEKLGLTFTYRYVPGHQDQHPTALDIWGTLNVRCDASAVALRVSHARSKRVPVSRRLFGEGPVLVVEGRRLVKDIVNALRLHLTTARMKSYVESRRVPLAGLASINSRSLEHAMQHVPLHRRIWISKMFYGFGPTGRNMHRRGQWTTAACPRLKTLPTSSGAPRIELRRYVPLGYRNSRLP